MDYDNWKATDPRQEDPYADDGAPDEAGDEAWEEQRREDAANAVDDVRDDSWGV